MRATLGTIITVIALPLLCFCSTIAVLQSKDFLRRMLIGRDVHVTMEYTREDAGGPSAGGERKFATVTLSRKVSPASMARAPLVSWE